MDKIDMIGDDFSQVSKDKNGVNGTTPEIIQPIGGNWSYKDFDEFEQEINDFFDDNDKEIANFCMNSQDIKSSKQAFPKLFHHLSGSPNPNKTKQQQIIDMKHNCREAEKEFDSIFQLVDELEQASEDLNRATGSTRRIIIATSCLYLIITNALDEKSGQELGKKLLLANVPIHQRLFSLVCKVVDTNRTVYPLKKLLLLLWKVVLIEIGGLDQISKNTDKSREMFKLPPRKPMKHKVSPQQYEEFKEETLRHHPSLVLPKLDDLLYPTKLPWDYFPAPIKHNPLDPYCWPTATNLVFCDVNYTLPSSFREALKVYQSHMYIRLEDVQFAEEKQRIARRAVLGGLATIEQGHARPNPVTDWECVHYFLETIMPEINTYCSTFVRLLYHIQIGMQNNSTTLTDASKNVMTKAISAIVLLILKHARSINIFFFEKVCCALESHNCLVLILKLFSIWFPNPNRPMSSHHHTFPEWLRPHQQTDYFGFISAKEIPQPVDNDTTDWTSFVDELPDNDVISWCNCFTAVNFLRILQKICKRKLGRIQTLVGWRACTVLKRVVRVGQPILQRYALKLIKMQMPFMEKRWKNSNLMLWSLIYTNLRVDLREDYVLSDVQLGPEIAQTQAEEWKELMDQFLQRNVIITDESNVGPSDLDRVIERKDWWAEDENVFKPKPELSWGPKFSDEPVW